MAKRRILALMLCLGLLWGCTSEPETPRETTEPAATEETGGEKESRAERFGLSYQPEAGLNPYSCTRLVNRTVMSLLYQGLFSVTSQYQAEPVLCRSYSCSSDLKRYSFTLENATFSDGSSLTAQDVVASLRRARNSPVYGDRLKHVTEITASQEGRVEITLDTACENLPVLLNIPIVPADQVDGDEPLGTGPYVLRTTGGSNRLIRRQNWWSEYPPAVDFDTIQLTRTGTPSDIRDQFEFGETDLVCADPGASTYVEYRCDYELWDCATGILLYLGCNTSGSSPFGNGAVRAALTHGVNRRALVEIYKGFAQEATLPASPEAPVYDTALASQFGYAPDAFSAALGQAGLRNTSATLLVCSDNPNRVAAAQAIAEQLTACGLNVTVNALGEERYLQALSVGNFDFYLGEVRLSPNFDLSVFFEEDGALTYGSMADVGLYQLCLKALENSGNYYELFEAVMEDGQLCPLLFRTYAVYATRGTVTDLLPGLDNVFHTANSRQLADAREDGAGPEETQPEETEVPAENG